MHKASKKKREKSSAKKERKATKTLAIVLGNSFFLSFFLPFSLFASAFFNNGEGECNKFIVVESLFIKIKRVRFRCAPDIYTYCGALLSLGVVSNNAQ